MNISSHQKVYLTAAGFLAVFAVLIIGVIFPLAGQVRQSSQKLAEQKQVIASLLQNWRKLETMKNDYQMIQQDLAGQNTFLPKGRDVDFFMLLENMAARTGNRQEISVMAESKNEGQTTTPKNELRLQMLLKGNFPNLVKMLVNLENASYFNDARSLQISRSAAAKESGGQPGEITSLINLTVYQP